MQPLVLASFPGIADTAWHFVSLAVPEIKVRHEVEPESGRQHITAVIGARPNDTKDKTKNTNAMMALACHHLSRILTRLPDMHLRSHTCVHACKTRPRANDQMPTQRIRHKWGFKWINREVQSHMPKAFCSACLQWSMLLD